MEPPALDPHFRWFKLRLPYGRWSQALGGFPYGDYVFRGITAHELYLSGKKPTTIDAENFILGRCVRPPVETDWNTAPVGVVDRLLESIHDISGLTEAGIPQAEAYRWISSPRGQMEAQAVACIQGLDMVSLRNADPSDYWRYIAAGKHMFETVNGIHAALAMGGGYGAPQGDGTIESGIVAPEAPPMVQPGQVATQNMGGFAWKKPRR